MEIHELIKEILGPQRKPLYVISSEELYFLNSIAQEIQDQFIAPEFQEFNQSLLYGKDTDVNSVVEQAREFPFFGEKRLIIVKEAQDLIKSKGGQDIGNWETLIAYSKNPLQSTLLIICFSKKPDGRSSWVKQLKDAGFYFELKPISDYQLPAFIKSILKELKMDMDEESQLILMDSIGNDLSSIYNELDKLKLNIPKGKKVNKEDISRFIGISKEYNVFELQKALSSKDHGRVYSISRNMAQHSKSNPLIATVAALFNHFQKIWLTKYYYSMSDDELIKLLKLPFKNFLKEFRDAAQKYSLAEIEAAIYLIKEYDLKAKGMNHRNTSEEELYLELALQMNQL